MSDNKIPYNVNRYATLQQLKENLRNCMDSCRILAKTIKEIEDKRKQNESHCSATYGMYH